MSVLLDFPLKRRSEGFQVRLLRGQLSGFSTERLMHFLALLGRDVEITVKRAPRSRREGHLRFVATA